MIKQVGTHHQVSDDHDQHEDEDAERLPCDLHAVPHGLYPLAAQHPEDDEERVEEVLHVPTRKSAVLGDLTHTFLQRRQKEAQCSEQATSGPYLSLGQKCYLVVFPKQLHADHGKDEDDDGEDERQVAQSAHRVPDDLYQRVESWP